MMVPETVKYILAIVLLLSLAIRQAQAIVLDWSGVTWSAGTLTQSFDIDSTNPGDDIKITISGSTGRFMSGYPAITDDSSAGFSGGMGPGTQNLEMYVDFSSDSQKVKVSIDFLYTGGVGDVDFTLFDVDVGTGSPKSFIDQITKIYATSTNGTFIAPSITTDIASSVSGSGTNQVVTGTAVSDSADADGNVAISYASYGITNVTFTYGNSSAAQNNPASQSIGLYDINFKKPVVPEVHPGLIASLLCASVAGGRWWWARRSALAG